MSSLRRLWALALVALGVASGAVGCKASECVSMLECCASVQQLEGVQERVGQSCGKLAEQTRDPGKCRDIKRTVVYMLEDRKVQVPASCQ